jgi:hypothetical protein
MDTLDRPQEEEEEVDPLLILTNLVVVATRHSGQAGIIL